MSQDEIEADPPIDRAARAGRGDESGHVASFHQVLILIALALFGGGSGKGSLSERASDVVSNDARRLEAVAIAEEIEMTVQQHRELRLELRDRFFELARTHGSTAGELEAALDRGVLEAERLQGALLNARTRLKSHVNAEEWRELFEDLD